MPATLDLRHESIIYTGNFARPVFELWGEGGIIVRQIYESLSPYGVGLQNFQLAPNLSTAADTVLTVSFGGTLFKFSFVRIDVSFSSFNEEEFQGIPRFLKASTDWLVKAVPGFSFAHHEVQYFSHSFLNGMTVDQFLKTLSSKVTKSAGFDLGGGVILHRSVPDKKWVTRLVVDKSQQILGALFIGLLIRIESGLVDYESLLAQGRAYFQESIGELALVLPNPA